MNIVIYLIAVVISVRSYGFATMNDTRPLYSADKADTFGVVSEGGQGGLSGRVMKIGQRTLTPLVPLNGQAIPSKAQYQNGTLVVGSMQTKGHPGVDQKNYYEIQIKGKDGQISGSFLVPEASLHGLSTYNAAAETKKALDYMKGEPMYCPDCGGLTLDSNKPSPEKQKEYKDQLYKQRAERRPSVLPASRYNPSPRETGNNFQRRDDIGRAPFAGGETVAVGDSTGLINTKSDDPGADNKTEGCEALTASEEERQENEELTLTPENLKTCISNIQAYMLQDISPPAKDSDRDKVFSRLFELPNEEQEFAAAIFTLTGEMEKGNKSDGLMILKVMQNRRDNSNKVEDKIKECKENGGSAEELSKCYAEANKDSVFNLLDIALHRKREGNGFSQFGNFSMYNDSGKPGEGNWARTIGSINNNQFDEALDVFTSYGNIDEYKITGGSNVDIDNIYHYTRPEWDPSWARNKPHLKITAIHATEGELDTTGAHVFIENVDGESDGFAANIVHEFREFP